MAEIQKAQYDFALNRIEELLPMVQEDTPANSPEAVELSIMAETVIEYEKKHFPIEKPTVSELIESSLEEQGMTQKQLAQKLA